MNKKLKLKYIIGIIVVLCVIVVSVLIVNFFEVKDDDAVKGSLVIWVESDTYDYMKKTADDFMELNGKADINIVQAGEDEVEAAISTNNMPDIAQLSSSKVRDLLQKYNNISLNIDENLISSFSKNYTKSRINEITDDNGLLGIPITSRPLVLYLREDMLESYGYTYSQINTWDDLISIGKDIKEKSGGKVSILNAVNQDYKDLKSLLIMQAMEESSNEEDIKRHIDNNMAQLTESGILNKNKNGEFLARISSINDMFELSNIDQECIWVACNVPARYNGSNRFYNDEGDNFVILKNYDKNNKLIKKFFDYVSNNNKVREEYILSGTFFSSFISSYNNKSIEAKINNFAYTSPLIVMNNIANKAPSINDYELYFKIKADYE